MIMASSANIVIKRGISTTAATLGKRNFRKFSLHNKRGTRIFKQMQFENPDPDIPFYNYGVRSIGYRENGRFVRVPEMVPELIVPDLTGCEFKPYVSYRAAEMVQPEFKAIDLFDAVYLKKIKQDFKEGKLDSNGNPLEPSEDEKLTAEEAFIRARKTGSDIF